MKIYNQSMDTLCAALSYAMGIKVPEKSAEGCEALKQYVDDVFKGEKVDRIFMYNPDAVAAWIYKKYPQLFVEVQERTEIEVPFCTVMPSVTPVCFGTMYTGAQPAVHGIQKYEKPVLSIETIFDTLIAVGKKPVILAKTNCSVAEIFKNRKMDYFIYDTIEEINAKAVEIILNDEHDFVVVYNGNYDTLMHKHGPESLEALTELRANAEVFAMFDVLLSKHWKKHNTLIGFAMDHGCHEIDDGAGSHGLDMPEDLNIIHLYNARLAQD